MAIDLSSSVGCSFLRWACQARTRPPIVGKYQVANNLEMHWLRASTVISPDRWRPQMNQPTHALPALESAPSKTAARSRQVHDQEGLNVMILQSVCRHPLFVPTTALTKSAASNFSITTAVASSNCRAGLIPTATDHSPMASGTSCSGWKDPTAGHKPSPTGKC